MKGHKDLRVFQAAYRVANEIFHLSKLFPKEEVYSLTDQIRRILLRGFENDSILKPF